jgi:hypothetical protein
MAPGAIALSVTLELLQMVTVPDGEIAGVAAAAIGMVALFVLEQAP